MPVSSSCPDQEELRRLLEGNVPEEGKVALLAHLNHCPICQQLLAVLTPRAEIRARVSTTLTSPGPAEEGPQQSVPESLPDSMQPTLRLPAFNPKSWIHSFLQPEAGMGFLGRFDVYEVTEVIGQGGMGIVLKAYDPALRRWVAIKVLAPHLASHNLARQRFAREGQATAAVRHEHVVTIHAVSETKALPFIVMDLLEGGSLQGHLDSVGRLEALTVGHLGLQIASGLAAAHAQELIHRDIKPSNILLREPIEEGKIPCAIIGDFGLARLSAETRLTQTGALMGTPMYMAPEQTRGEELDARADLFSLGSVLYTLSTGREPFSGKHPVAVMRHVCETTPTPVRDLNPAIPLWLADAIERLQAKQPTDRFSTASEVAGLIRHHLEHPEQDKRISLPSVKRTRANKPWTRRSMIVGLLLSAFICLVFGLVWWHGTGVRAESVVLRSTFVGHAGPIRSVAFAPDGQTLATGSDDSSVRLWDATGSRQIALLEGHEGAVYSIGFMRSRPLLVTGGGDGALRIWSVPERKERSTCRPVLGGISQIAISPDDTTIAVVGTDQSVDLWDVASGCTSATLNGHRHTVYAVAFSPDGRSLATGDADGVIKFWNSATGEERADFQADPLRMRALAFAPDGQQLAATGTSDTEVRLWEVPGGRSLATLGGHDHGVLSMAYAPDGRYLATGSRAGTVRLWDPRRGEQVAAFPAHRGSILCLAFSQDNRLLASGGEDRLGKVWALSTLP